MDILPLLIVINSIETLKYSFDKINIYIYFLRR